MKTGARKDYIPQLEEFLSLKPADKPFFLQLCSNDPHRPLDGDAIEKPHDPAALTLPGHYPDTKLVREDFARYYDEIARLDGDIGAVMAVLDRRGLKESTIVVFMGDNGCSQLRGKGTLNEFGIHIPLIVSWPGVAAAGGARDELVSQEDIAPTLLEAAGIAPPESMTGKSFCPIMMGKPFTAREYVFAERGAHGSALPTNSAVFDLGRVVVGRRHKLIYNALWQLPYHPVDFSGSAFWKEIVAMGAAGKLAPELAKIYGSPARPMFELYDIEKDPFELNNLSGKAETTDVEHTLKRALSEWMILEHDFLPLPLTQTKAKVSR